MKLVILGDLHIISPRDEFKEIHKRRAHFAQTWESLKAIQRRVRHEAPDLVISVGDLVDWYSNENRDEALEFLDKLGAPWLLTPGNHDIAGYKRDGKNIEGPFSTPEIEQETRKGWAMAGVILNNRQIEIGSTQLFLMDSSNISIPAATQLWLEKSLLTKVSSKVGKIQRILFTHVPFNIRPIREFIKSVKPDHNSLDALQRGTPDFYENLLIEELDAIYTGHLHFFPGYVKVKNTAMYLLPLSVVAFRRVYPQQGTVTVLQLDGSSPRSIFI